MEYESTGRRSDPALWQPNRSSEDIQENVSELVLATFTTHYEEPKPSRWTEADDASLWTATSFEWGLRTWGLPADAPFDIVDVLNVHIDDWHAALPFDEAERGLLTEVHAKEFDPAEADRTDYVREQNLEVVSSGLKRVIRGRDMLRRWWAWRRDTEEFEGQGSLDRAKTATLEMARILLPPNEFKMDVKSIQEYDPDRDYSRYL